MNIFDLQAKISLNASEFNTGIEQAQGAFQGLGGAVGAKAVAIGNVVGTMATKAAGDLVDFGKDAIQTGLDFNAAMSNVRAISGATEEDFQSLRTAALDLGGSTKFTASEVAEAFSYMAMAGWKTEDMLAGIGGVLNLAAAGNLDLGRSSDIVTDAMTAFGYSAADAGHFVDVLAQTAVNANTDVDKMGETFKYVAPVAGSLGYSVEDAATAIGTMANAGVKGSQAGTALRSALSHLLKPGDEAYKVLQKLDLIKMSDGVEEVSYDLEKLDPLLNKVAKAQDAYDKAVEKYGENSEQAAAKSQKLFEANLKVQKEKETQEFLARRYNSALVESDGTMISLNDTVGKLREAFSGLTEAEKGEYAATLFGQEALSGMLAIINSSEADYNNLSEAVSGASEEFDGLGAAQGIATEQQDNLQGDIVSLQSALSNLKIAVSDTFDTSFRESTQKARDAVNTITDGFREGGLQGALESISSLISTEFSNIVSEIESAVSGIEGPIGDFAALFSGTLMGGISTFADGVSDLLSAFQSAGADVIASIADSVGEFMEKFHESSIGAIMGEIAESAGNLFAAFKGAGETLIKGVAEGIGNFFGIFDESLAVSTLESIAEAVKDFFAPFSDSLSTWIQRTADALSDVIGFLGDFAGALSNEVVGMVRDIADSFEKWAPWVAAVAAGFITMQIVTSVAAGIQALKSAIQGAEIATKAYEIAQAALNAIMNANPIMLVVSAIAALVTGLVVAYQTNEDFRNSVDKAWEAIKEGAKAAFEALKEFFTTTLPEAFNNMVEWFKGLPDKFKEIGKNIVDGIKNGFTAAWESFKSTVSGLIDGIVGGVKDFFGIHSPSTVFAEIGSNLVAGMENGWSSKFGSLVRTVGTDMASLTSVANLDFEKSAIGMSSAAGISSIAAAGMGAGASRQPVEVNLVLDGEVAAKALFDPLRGVAYQKGKAAELYA